MTARGYFAIGVFEAKKETNIGTLLRTAHNFGAAYVFTIGRRYTKQPTDTTKASRHVPMFHYEDVADFRGHVPAEAQVIGVELHPDAVPLPAFTHPERAVYLLGAEDHGLTPDALDACDAVIQVPGAAHCLNVSVAGSIAIYDRIVKQGAAA